jgi:hypothetical protein
MEVCRRTADIIHTALVEPALCHPVVGKSHIKYLVRPQATRLAEVHERLAEAEAYIGQMADAIEARLAHTHTTTQVSFKQSGLLAPPPPCMTFLVLTNCSWRRPSSRC